MAGYQKILHEASVNYSACASGAGPSEEERKAAAAELLDRVSHVQVTDAVNGWVRVRILVTSYDAPTLYDLRCHVREELVAWVREQQPDALPVQRLLLDEQ